MNTEQCAQYVEHLRAKNAGLEELILLDDELRSECAVFLLAVAYIVNCDCVSPADYRFLLRTHFRWKRFLWLRFRDVFAPIPSLP